MKSLICYGAGFLLPLILFCFSSPSAAAVQLPAIIGNNMVLQQRAAIALWGWADPGEKITVRGSWQAKTATTVTGANGRWQVNLHTAKAGGPYTVTISGNNTIELKNIMLGEVWLCSGQSNMHFPLAPLPNSGWANGVFNYETEVQQAVHPNIRLFTVDRIVGDSVLADVKGQWEECSPQSVAAFSAVAYYFARKLQQETGVPVGLINSTWGGTPAESWTKKEVLEAGFRPIMNRYREQCREFPAALEQYHKALNKWKNDTSRTKPSAPKEPVGPGNSKSPYKLYNAMIAPLEPFTLRGVIWYQGESNAERAYQYRDLFPALIQNWRSDWHNSALPFYFVQISPHKSQNPEIREAQLLTYERVPHTGMVVTTDNGDSLNIHPRNKQLVGERLALWALHNEYGFKKLACSGPLYASMKTEGNKIRLKFTHTDNGLVCKGDALTEFTIAGNDGVFVPARAVIEGNTVVVSAGTVTAPVAVRFAWSNVPHPNFFNGAGLPASPFRTDQWKGLTEGKE